MSTVAVEAKARNPKQPVKVGTTKVTHMGSNNRVTRETRRVVVTLRDGTDQHCPHEHGHRSAKAIRSCAEIMVDKANRAIGINPSTYKEA